MNLFMPCTRSRKCSFCWMGMLLRFRYNVLADFQWLKTEVLLPAEKDPAKLIELFGNRTQSNPFELNQSIGFGNRTKSSQKICVRVQLDSIFKPNRT